MIIFFFSSRRRHTRSKRDWSSDVCSSDLSQGGNSGVVLHRPGRNRDAAPGRDLLRLRSEERRVGKECRSRWALDHQKKKGSIKRKVCSIWLIYVCDYPRDKVKVEN